MKKEKKREARLAVKIITCLIYLIIITFLSAYSYQLFQKEYKAISWSEAENTSNYAYIDIYKMSEKFAYYSETNVGIHYVINQEKNGLWHTYLIAINEDDYEKYKEIIDYTYERIENKPKAIRVYGYPALASNELKSMAIKNVKKFVPAENQVNITEENYDQYLTNSYLDTTKKKSTSFLLYTILGLLLIVIFLLLKTVVIQDKTGYDINKNIHQERIKKQERYHGISRNNKKRI